jgi:hypothetical protein
MQRLLAMAAAITSEEVAAMVQDGGTPLLLVVDRAGRMMPFGKGGGDDGEEDGEGPITFSSSGAYLLVQRPVDENIQVGAKRHTPIKHKGRYATLVSVTV